MRHSHAVVQPRRHVLDRLITTLSIPSFHHFGVLPNDFDVFGSGLIRLFHDQVDELSLVDLGDHDQLLADGQAQSFLNRALGIEPEVFFE